MEKDGFRLEEEAKQTGWREVNTAVEKEGFRSEEAAK